MHNLTVEQVNIVDAYKATTRRATIHQMRQGALSERDPVMEGIMIDTIVMLQRMSDENFLQAEFIPQHE